MLTANSDERIIDNSIKADIGLEVNVDTNNLDEVYRVIDRIKESHRVVAVVPGFEIYVAIAAKVADRLGLPGIGVETCESLRNKGELRRVLCDSGLRTVNYWVVDSVEKIHSLNFAYPCVLKPIDQSGSVRVSKVETNKQLLSVYEAMCDDTWTEMGKGIGSVAIVEEYIDGDEYSIEGYLDQREPVIISITKKILGASPFFVELGHIVNARLSESCKKMMEDYVKSLCSLLNLNVGVFHCEVRYDENGPVVVDFAARLAGDKICDLIHLATGVDLYSAMILSHANRCVQQSKPHIFQYAGIQFFSLPPGKKTFSAILGLESIQNLDGYYASELYYQPGDLVPPLTDFRGRVGYVIFVCDQYDLLCDNMRLAKELVVFN